MPNAEAEFDLAQKLATYTPLQLSSLLFWYLKQGRRDVRYIEAIFKAGAIPSAVEANDERSYLTYAKNKEEVDMMVNYGVPLDMKSFKTGVAAIHWIVAAGYVEACKSMAGHGADMRQKDNDGRDPLAEAEAVLRSVEVLIRRLPQPGSENYDPENIAHQTVRKNTAEEMVAYIKGFLETHPEEQNLSGSQEQPESIRLPHMRTEDLAPFLPVMNLLNPPGKPSTT